MNRIQYTITGETLFKGIVCSLISAEQTFEVKSTSRNLDGNGHHKGTNSWTYVIQMPAEAKNFMPTATGESIQLEDLDGEHDLQSLAQSARDEYASDELEIDEEPRFSHSDSGSWVSAWVWVAVESDEEASPELCECGRKPQDCSFVEGGEDIHGDR